METIKIQSPTRVDLAGGTLDLWPLYLFVGNAVTINVAISIYTGVELTPLSSNQIELESSDINFKKTYNNLSDCLSDSDDRAKLLQSQIKYWKPKKGFKLKTFSQSPVGGGLGGSSSLTISMMKAFSVFVDSKFNSNHQMVHVAHNIEAEVLNTPTGTQDYYPAISGGVNILKYSQDGIEQEVLKADSTALAKNFMLVYTGKSHHSGLNNFEVLTHAIQRNNTTMSALKELSVISDQMVMAVKNQEWTSLGALFRREYESRIKLAPAFSSPEIQRLSELSLQNGAEAVKICGAGGGGCVLVWCEPSHQERVRQACQREGFQVLAAQPVNPL